MTDVPASPVAFFSTYLPGQLSQLSSQTAGKTSLGSLVFRVVGVGEWTIRVKDGAFVISEGTAPDVLVQVTTSEADFDHLVVSTARAVQGAHLSPERQVFAMKALSVDAQKANLVKMIPGGLALLVKDEGVVRKLAVTPGTRAYKFDDAECRAECSIDDFREMQSGKIQPLQLVMNGKMRLVGNAQIPMALSAVFA